MVVIFLKNILGAFYMSMVGINLSKRFIALDLIEPLDRYRKVLYSGLLPFDYDKEIGKGERCGVVEQASLNEK